MYDKLKTKLYRFVSDSRFSEILAGSAWALPSRILGACLTLVATVIIARVYGAGVLGIVALVTSFLSLTTVFSVFGTSTSILRIIPEHAYKYSYSSAYKAYCKTQFLVIGVSVIVGVLLFFGAGVLAGRLFGKPELSFYFRLSAVFVVFQSLVILNTQASRGLKLVKTFALLQFMPQGLNLGLLLSFGLLSDNRGVPVYALLGSSALAGIVSLLIIYSAFKKKMQPGDPVDRASVKDILTLSLPMLVSSAMALVVDQASVIVLGIFGSVADVGYFAVASRFAVLTTFMLTAINSIAAPKFAELFHSGKVEELLYVAKKSTKLIFWTTTPVLLCLIFLGRPVIRIFYGPHFLAAYGALLILVFGQFVNSASGSTGYFVNMTGDQVAYQNIMIVAALACIILNVLLVPRFGIEGAALAGSLSLVIWNVYLLILIKRKYGRTIGYVPLLGTFGKSV